jgi:hypothetical protein
VRPHWRNALGATVKRFTGRAQIRHFVMAITERVQNRVSAKLQGRGELGDGAIYRLCRELQRELFSPPLATERGHRRGDGK